MKVIMNEDKICFISSIARGEVFRIDPSEFDSMDERTSACMMATGERPDPSKAQAVDLEMGRVYEIRLDAPVTPCPDAVLLADGLRESKERM